MNIVDVIIFGVGVRVMDGRVCVIGNVDGMIVTAVDHTITTLAVSRMTRTSPTR